jgi:hypothetical protein
MKAIKTKKMENLNEGKKKKMSYMAELAEIDKQSAIVAMEAKIDKLAEMVEAKTQRLSMVSEDENLSELIDKKQVKIMEKEIKEIEKAKLKLEKLYEKAGGKKKEMVDEVEELEEETVEEGGYDSNYEEDDSKVDEGHDPEDDGLAYTGGVLGDYMDEGKKEETNEEVDRFKKLAGL